MAALTTSGVALLRALASPIFGGSRITTKRLTLTLSSAGTNSTDTIDASTLGFTSILSCSNAIKDDNTLVLPAVPSYDGSKILLVNTAGSTAANHATPATISGTFRIAITGYAI